MDPFEMLNEMPRCYIRAVCDLLCTGILWAAVAALAVGVHYTVGHRVRIGLRKLSDAGRFPRLFNQLSHGIWGH